MAYACSGLDDRMYALPVGSSLPAQLVGRVPATGADTSRLQPHSPAYRVAGYVGEAEAVQCPAYPPARDSRAVSLRPCAALAHCVRWLAGTRVRFTVPLS
jgi:hypothetical protein